jgi:molybdenum cofactor cytidylyltransferase
MTERQSDRVAGVILAAGSGSRMGTFPKVLLELDGEPLLQHVIGSAMESQLAELHVVLGYESARVLEKMPEYSPAQITVNPDFEQGQSTSVKAGFRSISSSMNAGMVLLGDQPGIPSKLINQLISAYTLERPLLVIPRYNGKRGNPVIIDRLLFGEIEALKGDIGARALFEAHHDDVRYVDFPFPAPLDIDTPADLEARRRELGA